MRVYMVGVWLAMHVCLVCACVRGRRVVSYAYVHGRRVVNY